MAGSEGKIKNFTYSNKIKWTESRKGVLSSSEKPDIEIATPPEFKGHPGIWSPEDLLVAAVNSCILTTFLYYADAKKLEFQSFESDAQGLLELSDGGFIFTEIQVTARIKVKEAGDIEKAKMCLNKSEKNCLISNSIKADVKLIPEINTAV